MAEITQNIVSHDSRPTIRSGATSLAEVKRGDFKLDVLGIQKGWYLRNEPQRPLACEDAFAEQSWLQKS